MSVNVEDVLKQQKTLAEDITKFLTNLKKDPADRINSGYIQRRVKTLNDLWEIFNENNKTLFSHKDNIQPYFTRNTFYETQQLYQEASALLGKKMCSIINNTDNGEKESPEQSDGAVEERNRKIDSLAINEIHLADLCSEIEGMEMAIESLGTLEMMADELKMQFIDWKNCFIEVQRYNIDDYDKQRYDKHHKKYVKLSSKMQDAINVARNVTTGAAATNIKNTAELPKIKIPEFDGDIMKWKTFYELYNQVVHQNTTLGNAAKMHFLKTYVRGEAARLINHLPPTAENYSAAYTILISRYENTRVLLGKLLDSLLDLPQLKNESCKDLKSMHDSVFECLRAIENLNVATDQWDAIITHILVKKLDNETRKSYECQLEKPKEPQKVSELLKFIEARFMALETYEQRDVNNTVQGKNSAQQNKNKKHAYQQNCSYCGDQHSTVKCDAFLKLNDRERFNAAKEKKMCSLCLRSNHKTHECTCKFKCEKCQKNHNSVLHLEAAKKFDKGTKTGTNIASSSIQSMMASNQVSVLLATAIINVYGIHGLPISLRALIDQGSQSAFITENAVQMLSLPRKRIQATITGIGEQTKHANHSVQITITPRVASSFTLLTNAVVLEKLSTTVHTDYEVNEWNHIKQLQLADPAFYEGNKVDILLGAAEYAKIIKNGLVKGEEGAPIAQNTELGWIISGNSNKKTPAENISIRSMVSTAEVNEFLKKFWEINEISNQKQQTSEEKECEEHFNRTHRRLENGRYVVQLPLRDNKVELGQTKNMAVATFLQLEKKFARNKDYFNQYKQFIDEYIELGHMVETNENAQDINYLPHHAVFKESSTTKIRVVFDASRKSSNQKSLNDNLMVGPTIQPDMVTIMMRWRKHRIAFTADIEKMYRQILVHKEHTNLQRIIWRNAPNERLRDYKLVTVTYGTSCAPYLAIKTLNQLAFDEEKNSPDAAKIIRNDFYVDDVASGADNVEQAMQFQRELKETLASGGFNLRKWASNSPELLRAVPEYDREVKMHHDIIIDSSATIKTLGIKWNPSADTFEFKINTADKETGTKRELLSEIAALYDPLGWLAPVIIKAKILIQESWSTGIGWDEKLPVEIKNNWAKIKNELPTIESIKIPRWINTSGNTQIQLHGFCDASESAYAAVIYIKTININGEINVSLLTAKTKVAPLKKDKITIPRLELCGATLLATLAQQVINAMQINIENVFLWCDSKVVLAWIKGNPNRWKSFVANRAIEINGKFKTNVWNYVQTKQNPADCASRGIFPAELKDFELWWNGPTWLHSVDTNTQESNTLNETTNLEEKTIIVNNTCIQLSILPVMKSYFKLQTIMALCLRFIHNCRNKTKYKGQITALEYRNASNTIIRAIQREHFAKEIAILQGKKELKSNSDIRKLNPFVDDKGLLRVGGRLTNAKLNYSARHQLLLPHDHFITDLIIKKVHIESMHGGPMLTESLIRQQYWIVKGYRRIKTIIHECAICRRYSNAKMQQYMGDLPKVRVTGIRAFINCGVDYAGPISVRTNRGRGYRSVKGYIAVFVCLATKAIHLECVSDMTADAFMAAFKRFTARRGAVSNIYSDNGTNFVKANTMLKSNTTQEENEYGKTIFSEMAKIETQWHFIPPASPNFGGLWEAGVKSVKTHMKKSIGDSTLTFEELNTLLCQIEATLNSRPLCALSADTNDTATLTPGHFLIGSAILAPPEVNFLDTNTNRLSRWQLIQKMHQNFWKRWSTEYLNRLQERPKWLKKIVEPNINDLVLIKEENLPPAKWATGRIINKYPGQDGLTRVVEVQINNKTFKRPLSKICSLPGDNSDVIMDDDNKSTQKVSANSTFIRQKSQRPKLTLAIMTLMITSIITMTQPATMSKYINITPFEFQPGVYFESYGTAYLSNTKWNIIAYYDLKNYMNDLNSIRKSIKSLKNICGGLVSKHNECIENIKQLEQHFEEINEKNQIINGNEKNRQRRATLNFVGNILGDVFGVLDSNFAEEYSKDLGKINTNEEHLLLLMKNHTSVAETTLNIVKNNENTITIQTDRINRMITDIQQLTNEQERINQVISATFRIVMALTKYEATQNNIMNVLLDVHNNQINVNILAPEQLKTQLQKIHSAVDASILVPGEDAHDELRSLYSIMSIQAIIAHNQIIFKITLPLIFNERFQLFKLIAVPTIQDNGYLWFEPSTPFLLTTLRRNYYYPMTELELGKCKAYGKNSIICERKNQMFGAQARHIGCEIQLLNHAGNLNGNCKFKTSIIADTWIALHEPNKWIYAIYNHTQMDVICNNQIEHLQIHGEGIIQLQPHCTIRHAETEITAQNNYDIAIHDSILPEVNIIVEIDKYKQTRDPGFITFHKSNISTLDELIQTVKKQEEHLPETINAHDYHHYGLGYILMCIIFCYFVFRFIRRKKHNQRDIHIQMEPARAIRTISMPDLGRENV